MSDLYDRLEDMAISGPNVPSCQLCGKARDALQSKDKRIAELEALVREWRASEWMVTHDWGGDRDALQKKTLAILGEPDDGSFDSGLAAKENDV